MRTLRIHDTLSGEIREVAPRDGGEVGIYACGPTTYSRIHVGNARAYVVFVLVRRLLEHIGYSPTLVINVTDVNDKIYTAAAERGVGSDAHAREMVDAYVADTDALGLGRPDHEPKATETIAEIINLIEALVGSGHAYESGGDVYFRVRSFDGYGKLSNRDPDEMDQGEETGSAELKESPLDFALWKARKPSDDTSWASPWGEGRPGWHIECSAMAEKLLGTNFEIHGGGSDLIFPHHENEIAQTEAGRGEPLARLWMHNGMVRTADEKMSKSIGNIFQLSEAVERFGGPAVIGFLVSGHYRQPIAFSEDALRQSAAQNDRIRNFLRERALPGVGDQDAFVLEQSEKVIEALCDDFNTPKALAAVFDLVAEGNRRELAGSAEALGTLLPLLGLDALLEGADEPDDDAMELLAERDRARADKDFDRADAIRDQLGQLGWEVRDGGGGARLVRRTS